jgi:hypothetical protein
MKARIASVALLGWLCLAAPSHGIPFPPGLPVAETEEESLARIDAVLAWLPVDTETFIISRSPEWFGKHTRLLTVEGSRQFRQGNLRYEGCTIHIFDKDLGEDGKALIESLGEADPVAIFELDGCQVFRFKRLDDHELREPPDEELRHIFVAIPRPNVLLWATHRGYLEEVLKQMKTPPAVPALSTDHSAWKYLDSKASSWSIRLLDRTPHPDDVTSPRSKRATDVGHYDGHARALLFSSPTHEEKIHLFYLSDNEEALQIAEAIWTKGDPVFSERVQVRERERGVIEITHPNDGAFILFVVLPEFGKLIYH